jgi:cysteine desulfurase
MEHATPISDALVNRGESLAVYLDHNATSPLDPRVRDAMLPWLGELHGNPSSLHRFGQAAREAVENARAEVAALLGAEPPEIVFASSGTEANNAVVFDAARRAGFRGRLVISSFEHPSVREAAAAVEAGSKDPYRMEHVGMEVVRIDPGRDGVVPAEEMIAALTDDTRLVCLMQANNEVGTLQPVRPVAEACRERGIPILCDAVQAVGKVPVDVHDLGVDYLTLGGHKFHGPLGVAALWIRSSADFEPYLLGGSQERRRRASTENVPGVVGLGEACRLAREELEHRHVFLGTLRDRFERGLVKIPGSVVHCADSPRLPHTSHVAFRGIEGEGLLIRLDLAGFAVSTGSACSSGAVEPSATLLAMGIATEEALASLRISFGMTNTVDEVDRLLDALAREVAELRRLTGRSAEPPRRPETAEVLRT